MKNKSNSRLAVKMLIAMVSGIAAGLIFMGVCQKEVFCAADLFVGQMGMLITGIAALIAAVHDKGRRLAAHKITVPLLCAGFTRQKELHSMPPRRVRLLSSAACLKNL